MAEVKHPHIKWYLDNGFHDVHGYCKRHVGSVLDLIESSPYNKKGEGVAEIGIHVGRLYILLNRTVSCSKHKSYAIDVFENQSYNIDGSGKGNKETFLNNLVSYDLYGGNNTVIIEADSTDSQNDLVNRIPPGSLKYVSIDGGHTPAHVVNDLKLAEKWIHNEGVVLVDDIMHEGWIGVIQGTLSYLSSNPTLQPFAIGYNKLWMAKVSMKERYRQLMEDSDITRRVPQVMANHLICTLTDSGHTDNGAHWNHG